MWIATSSGAQTLGATPNATVTGALTVNVDNLSPATQYFVVCRARDEAQNRDTNKVEKSATTSDDATPPTFAGIDTSSFDETNRTLNLTWLAATDDRTAQNQIVYDVYQRVNGANFDFTKPPLVTSAPGATSIDISGLPSNATLGWVVRARDEALNDDNNVVQVNGTTLVSYALDIQPIFSKNCAVVGCHVSGNPTGGMSLSSAVSYGNIVNVTSSYMGLKRIDPTTPIDTSASYLLRKTQTVSAPFAGNPMPAPGTGNSLTDDDKTKLLLWVQQKAPNN